MKIVPVILAGGSGTRLWPLSRKEYPKQFHNLTSDISLIQETVLRLEGIKNLIDPVIICNDEHRFIVLDQMSKVGCKNPSLILEPQGRNTGPAITAAALFIEKEYGKDSIMLVLSSDHYVNDQVSFKTTLEKAIDTSSQNKLILLGIAPQDENNRYGYIKPADFSTKKSVYDIESFEEKPSKEKALEFYKDGSYLWNSGMFIFKTEVILDEVMKHSSDVFNSVSLSINHSEKDSAFIRLEKNSFSSSPSISIDHAVLQKSNRCCVIPLDVGWSDVGTWSSLFDVSNKDSNNNLVKGDVVSFDTKDSLIFADKKLVITHGVSDLLIIDTPDATLIMKKDDSEKVKDIVSNLEDMDRRESRSNKKVYRPWGWYESIKNGDSFQVKTLHVNPHSKLSLQKHSKRAEHWVVTSGIARVTLEDDVKDLSKGQSIFIPIEAKHSLENTTNEILEVVEVQSGEYLGEDDIVRFEDSYGRVKKDNE